MIRLHTAATPNGRKASIALEELGLDYEVHHVHLDQQQQLTPEAAWDRTSAASARCSASRATRTRR